MDDLSSSHLLMLYIYVRYIFISASNKKSTTYVTTYWIIPFSFSPSLTTKFKIKFFLWATAAAAEDAFSIELRYVLIFRFVPYVRSLDHLFDVYIEIIDPAPIARLKK